MPKLNLAPGKIVGGFLLAGTYGAAWLLSKRKFGSLVMLGLPLFFYPLSMAYGGVPIFLPVWWPFSYYNVRYGLQLLPAFDRKVVDLLRGFERLVYQQLREPVTRGV